MTASGRTLKKTQELARTLILLKGREGRYCSTTKKRKVTQLSIVPNCISLTCSRLCACTTGKMECITDKASKMSPFCFSIVSKHNDTWLLCQQEPDRVQSNLLFYFFKIMQDLSLTCPVLSSLHPHLGKKKGREKEKEFSNQGRKLSLWFYIFSHCRSKCIYLYVYIFGVAMPTKL